MERYAHFAVLLLLTEAVDFLIVVDDCVRMICGLLR